jgi:hypothetical protein
VVEQRILVLDSEVNFSQGSAAVAVHVDALPKVI